MDNNDQISIKISTTSNLPWPYYQNRKAISPSTLTSVLREIEYKDKEISQIILLRAANNGKIFHKAIQDFLENGDERSYLYSNAGIKTLEKIRETIDFFKENKFSGFVGSEKLYHSFYKESFFASYIDLEFDKYVIELKTNNTIIDRSPMSVLAFKVQLLIQKLCTNKNVFLLWSTGRGVFFHKFEEEKELFEILEVLINIVENKEIYSFEAKKEIIERLLAMYASNAITGRLLEKWEDQI